MSKKLIPVTTLGVDESEVKKLASIFWLSAKHPSRTQGYELITEVGAAKIIIINADAPQFVAEWRQHHATTVAVMLTDATASHPGYHLLRPLVATSVLRVLDAIDLEVPTQHWTTVQEENTSTTALHSHSHPPLNSSQPKILVVDDSLPIRKRMSLELQALELTVVDFADSYVSAMNYLDSTHYAVVFLDVVLPDGDGYQICKSIKGKSTSKSTKVIMLTGKTSPFDKVKGKLSGCDSYLTKPVDRETLQKTIQRYLTHTS